MKLPTLRLLYGIIPLLVTFGMIGTTRAETPLFQLAVFKADVTPPVGHMLFTGRFQTALEVESPLEARGFVLQIKDQPAIVICSIDWAEIRNESYDDWRNKLAEAAGTTRERVLVSSIHQHDTPLDDLGAESALRKLGSKHQVIDPEFHDEAVNRVVEALSLSLTKAEPVTHIGIGNGKVDRIASNRRYELADGTPKYDRGSACKNLTAQRAPDGAIDPFLKSLSFWNEDKQLAVYNVYATHPMSYYGTRKINADFPGLARDMRQKETPATLQIYASGCSGNVTAGKYNSGLPENRPILSRRLYDGIKLAADKTSKQELSSISFQNERLKVMPRTAENFTRESLEKTVREKEDARSHLMASLGLSWLDRIDREGSEIDVPSVIFNDGLAQIILLPGEIYVEYQLYAQSLAPDRFLMTPAYGESAPGYIPLEMQWQERDSNLGDWCWVAEGMEAPIKQVLRNLVNGKDQ